MWVQRSNKTSKKQGFRGVFLLAVTPQQPNLFYYKAWAQSSHITYTPDDGVLFLRLTSGFLLVPGWISMPPELHTHSLHTRCAPPLHCTDTTSPDFSGKQWKCHTSAWGLFLYSTTHFWDPLWLPKKQSLGKIWLIMLSGWLSLPWVEFHGECAHVGCTKI